MALEFRVLGPIEVVHDGVATRIGSSTQRTLLALLLQHPGKVVSTDRIVDVLWPGNPPDARRKLWFHVSKLRRILEPSGAEDATGKLLGTRPTGYFLRIELDQLDATRFEHLAGAARRLLRDEPARAGEMLRTALALWQGEPFQDVLHEEALSPEVARLNELRLAAVGDRLEADLALGRAGDLIPELEALVAEHPYHEHLLAQLMLAYYRAGRQADALAGYRAARHTLVEQLGVEPSERLQELHRGILGHDRALAGTHAFPVRVVLRREERKVVTVVFADLLDAGAKARAVDPEEVRAFLSPHHARVRSALEQFGGTVEKLIGETVLAVFGAPATHEDDPERAVRAALSVRDLLTDQGENPHVRIAVATGEALVTPGASAYEREPIAVGQVVQTAARLRHAAPVDVVLVDGPTFRRTSDAIEYREAAPIAVASTNEAISVWEAIRPLAGPGVGLSRHRTPFVGRERELALLHERLEWAASERSPQLVTILGVPGIGKSRLVSQMEEAVVRRDETVTWRKGRALPYGDGVGFWALGEIVKAQAGILESDPPAKVERKLAAAVRRVIDDPAEAHGITTHLGLLVGLGGDEATAGDRRSATFTAWRQFLEALADERPLVLVFEDLHWADAGLLDFVDELLDRVRACPSSFWRRRDRSSSSAGRTGREASRVPSRSRCRHCRSPRPGAWSRPCCERPVLTSEDHGALLPRIGGNPLYAEQFCRMLAERGRLEALPETLHGIIAARLDGLAHAEKRLLQDAAVLGKVFWLGALEAVGRVSRTEAEALLSALVRRGFVQRARRSSVAGDIEYAFVHQLLRDVAYSEITHTDRAERHRWAAEWIDSLGRPEEHAELVAHHYVVALDYTRAAGEDVATLAQQAMQALHRAGLRAIRLSANERAVEHFAGAITLVGQLPETDERSRTEAELQLQLGVALLAERGLGAPEVEQAYIRATELMMDSAPAAEHFPAQVALSIYHGHRGDFDRSMRLVERLTELASQGDDSMRLQALHARWMNCLFAGQIDAAIAAADAGRAIYRPDVHHSLSYLYGNHDPCVCALALQALALALRGDSVRAVSQMHEAIDLGEALGHAVHPRPAAHATPVGAADQRRRGSDPARTRSAL